jgi:outer membrane immunogenic protein
MKRITFGISAIIAMIGASAFAADLPLKAPALPVSSWTGFYIGGFVGGAGMGPVSTPDGTNPATVTTPFAVFPPGVPTICKAFGTPGLAPGCVANYGMGGSVIAGGTAGYNWQFGRFVTGLEGEVGYLHLSGAGPLPNILGAPCGPAANPCVVTMSSTVGNAFGTLAARFGVTSNFLNPVWSDRILLFAKVGAAVTNAATSQVDVGNPALFILPATLSGSTTVWGVAAGAGVEWMFNRRWSVKAEYEFLGFNKTVTGCGILPAGANGQNGTWCTQTSIGPVETGKVGVNYHF